MSYAVHPEPSASEDTWTRDDWNTPEWILAPIREFAGGQIGLDPAWNGTSGVNAKLEWGKKDNSLPREWCRRGLVFVNPPYSRGLYDAFAQKITVEGVNGTEIVALVPTNCETKAWQNGFWKADAICFLNRRVKFLKNGKPKGSPAGGNALVYFGKRIFDFHRKFSALGKVVLLNDFSNITIDGGEGPGSTFVSPRQP